MNLPDNPSDSFKRANPHVYGKPAAKVTFAERHPQATSINLSIAPTTDRAKLNKSEAEYGARLEQGGHQWVGVQNVTLKLADDTRYTPDFSVLTADGVFEFHEVKGGFFRDDAKVKTKVAARQFRWARFKLARKTTKDGWVVTEVKP